MINSHTTSNDCVLFKSMFESDQKDRHQHIATCIQYLFLDDTQEPEKKNTTTIVHINTYISRISTWRDEYSVFISSKYRSMSGFFLCLLFSLFYCAVTRVMDVDLSAIDRQKSLDSVVVGRVVLTLAVRSSDNFIVVARSQYSQSYIIECMREDHIHSACHQPRNHLSFPIYNYEICCGRQRYKSTSATYWNARAHWEGGKTDSNYNI